ncbi:MAG: rhomboid family intramembrane serine protease [Bacteroidota bacterium]|nr:rhomboid family intramembrane serine protease [Ferruginibacter sp.]
MELLSITIGIIAITCIISFSAFSSQKIMDDLIFWPTEMREKNQWYRFISSGFLHGDGMHLIFNMFTLFLFGQQIVEPGCEELSGKWMYLVLYFGGMVVADIPSYLKNKNNYQYRSLGASGAVSAVVFAGIVFYPTMKMGFFFIPPVIPAYIFGPLYLIYCIYAAKKSGDNINHDAHLWGALFGLVFPIALHPFLFNQMVAQISGSI